MKLSLAYKTTSTKHSNLVGKNSLERSLKNQIKKKEKKEPTIPYLHVLTRIFILGLKV